MNEDGTQEQGETQPPGAAEQLRRVVERYREALIAANPDVVPELVRGADVEEVDRSLVGAKVVYARVREAARAELAASPAPTNPARRNVPPAGIEAAGPLAKIAWGLREAGR